jgi:hypothetical protein
MTLDNYSSPPPTTPTLFVDFQISISMDTLFLSLIIPFIGDCLLKKTDKPKDPAGFIKRARKKGSRRIKAISIVQ